MALEVFANNPTTGVTSGGTDAPAPGTVQTWTVVSAARFPTASNSASPPTQFHISDPAAPSEIMAVTNTSGATWTVTRGAEGTTPVPHSSGFSVEQVVTAGALGLFLSTAQVYNGDLTGSPGNPTVARINGVSVSGTPGAGKALIATSPSAASWSVISGTTDWINVVTQYGADPTGVADSTTAIQNAINSVPFSKGGVVYLPAGTYKVSSTLTIATPKLFLVGDGRRVTTLDYHGSGDCIYMHADTYAHFSTYLFEGGGIRGLTIDGTNSSAATSGLNFGDWYACDFDIQVIHFSTVGSYGVRFFNSMGFSEKNRGYFEVAQCDTCFTFDVSTTTSTANRSFGYTDIVLEMDGMTGNGIVVQNGAQVYHSRIIARANVSAGVGSTYACIKVTGKCAAGIQNPGSASQIGASRLDFQAEANSATNVQQTINIDLGNNCRIYNCTGILDFNFNFALAQSNVSQTSAGSTYFQYSGVVSGDTNLNPGGAGSGFVTAGPRLYSQGRVDASSGTIYAALGDFFKFTLSANVTISLLGYSPNVAGPQRKTIIIQQAASGGPYTVTWPTSGSPSITSPNVVWTSGVTPAQTTAANGVNVYTLTTYDGATWYGQAHTQDSVSGIVPAKVTALRSTIPASGQYLVTPNSGTSGTSAGPYTLGNVYYTPVQVQATQTFTGISMNLSAQAAGGTSPLVIMGIYNDIGTGTQPTGSPVTGSQVSYNPVTQATGNVDIAFSSPLTLTPGTYWLAWVLTSGSALSGQPTFVTLTPLGNTVLTTLGNNSQKGWQSNTATNATNLPTGISPAVGGGSWPIIGLKAQ